jgi:hypothetical protein
MVGLMLIRYSVVENGKLIHARIGQCLKIRSKQKNRTPVIPSDFIKFGKIRSNFDWRKFCTVNFGKQKNIRIYRLIGPNFSQFGPIHPKFGGIVEVIEV